jgi:O-antigen ligase
MTLGVFATLSRGSVVALASIYLTLILLKKGRSHSKSLPLFIALSIMVVSLVYVFPDSFEMILERFGNEDYVESMDSRGSRGNLMKVGLQLFLNSPVWGSGLGSVYATTGSTPHDGYTGLLGEMGVIGFVLFYALPFTTLAYLAKMRKRLGRRLNRDNFLPTLNVFYSFMVGILVIDLFNPIIYMKPAFLLIALTRLFIAGGEAENKHRSPCAWYEFLCPMRRREVRDHGPMPWQIMPVRKKLLGNQTLVTVKRTLS